jgi:hypothetical protein
MLKSPIKNTKNPQRKDKILPTFIPIKNTKFPSVNTVMSNRISENKTQNN